MACAVATAFSPGAGADPQRTRDALLERESSPVRDLFVLDQQLAGVRAEVAGLQSHAAAVRARLAEVRREQRRAAGTLARAQVLLSTRVPALYEAGGTAPLASVLASRSLSEAMGTIDGLEAAAAQDRALVERTRAARGRLAVLAEALAKRSEELRALEAAAAARALALAAAREERGAYVERLQTGTQAAVEVEPQAVARLERTLSVTATGYSLEGPTAAGLPAGWGVAAVDPAVIPLGTRLNVPGYGTAMAADTGSGVGGMQIDLWFPTLLQARAWGRRTLMITLE